MRVNFCLQLVCAALPLAGCYRLDCSFDNSCPPAQLTLSVDKPELNLAALSDLKFSGSTFFSNEQYIVAEMSTVLPLPPQTLSYELPGQAPSGHFTIAAAALKTQLDTLKLRCGSLELKLKAVADQDNAGTYFQSSNGVELPLINGLPSAVARAGASVSFGHSVTKIGFHPTAQQPHSVYANYVAGVSPTLGIGQLSSDLATLTFGDAPSDVQFAGEISSHRLALKRGKAMGDCNRAKLVACPSLESAGDLSLLNKCPPAVFDFPWCFPALASDASQDGKFLANISGAGDLYLNELASSFDPASFKPSPAPVENGKNCRALAIGDLDADKHNDVLALRKGQPPLIYRRSPNDMGFIPSTDAVSTALADRLNGVAPELRNDDAVVAIGQLPGSLGGSYLIVTSNNTLSILIPGSGQRCPFSLPAQLPTTTGSVTAMTLAKTKANLPAEDLLLIGHAGAVHIYELTAAGH